MRGSFRTLTLAAALAAPVAFVSGRAEAQINARGLGGGGVNAGGIGGIGGIGYGGLGNYGLGGPGVGYGGLGGLGGGYGGFGNYGYGINNGRIGNGYNAGFGYNGINTRPQTVTNYQPLVGAITSIPGWYGHPTHTHHPTRPTVARDKLLGNDGTILWPEEFPNDPAAEAARKAADESVKAVVNEHDKYGSANVRGVVEARAKLNEVAAKALPELKAKDAPAAADLERFIVELRKTLTTLAVNY